MWEIALCVAGYITVLWIEFAPTFLERFGLHNAREKLSRVLFIIIALGVLLPTMHQSSLGTAIVILGHKVSPLWQTQFLPLLYLSSAILMGLALVPFESVLSALGLRRQLETGLMGRLNRVILAVGAIFLAVRLGDLLFRGALGHALAGDLQANMFLLESALFIGGLALLARQQARRSARAQFVAAVTLLMAGILFRINSYLVGYEPVNGTWHYFPSVPEMLVTVGIFSIEILLYLVFVKKLPVLAKHA
jgi:Ni/Fe-hydrogenase subunit HybB-like protein